jgi:uncharacterized membrane protein
MTVAAFWDFAKFQGAEGLQNLHPLIVHYPIAFLTASAPIYFLAWILHSEPLEAIGFWLLGLGTIGAAAAAYTGWLGSQGVMIAPSVRDHILVYHQWLMTAVLLLSVLLAGWALVARPMPQRGRPLFMIGLVLVTLVLAKGADYGGWMVFGYNAGGSLPQPIDFSK